MGQVGEYAGRIPTERNRLARASGMSARQCIAGYSVGSELQKARSVISKMNSMSESPSCGSDAVVGIYMGTSVLGAEVWGELWHQIFISKPSEPSNHPSMVLWSLRLEWPGCGVQDDLGVSLAIPRS